MTDAHHTDDAEQPEDAAAQDGPAVAAAQGHDAHGGDAHGGDAHGHDDEPLGPIDVPAWGAGLIGVIAGVAIAAAFVLATAPI